MATERPVTPDTTATTVLESADFVSIVTRTDGDGVAAAGLLARALSDLRTPFQVSVERTVADRTRRLRAGDTRDAGHVTVAIGPHDAADGRDDGTITLAVDDRPASLAAADLVADIGSTADPLLTLAGTVAAGLEPGAGETEWVLDRATEGGLLEQRPGVAIPTEAFADGLAHSTAVVAPWSGDRAAVDATLERAGIENASVDESTRRTVASLVSLDVVGAPAASEYAATAVGRFLRPHAIVDDAPQSFATLEGYADVLEATAQVEPGTGIALAMGHDVHQAALEAWRRAGRRAHAAIDGASTGRYDGLYVVGIDDGPVRTVASLTAAYRSPEPAVCVLGADELALVTRRDESGLAATVEAIARDLDAGDYDVGPRGGTIRLVDGDGCDDAPAKPTDETIIAAVREYL